MMGINFRVRLGDIGVSNSLDHGDIGTERREWGHGLVYMYRERRKMGFK